MVAKETRWPETTHILTDPRNSRRGIRMLKASSRIKKIADRVKEDEARIVGAAMFGNAKSRNSKTTLLAL